MKNFSIALLFVAFLFVSNGFGQVIKVITKVENDPKARIERTVGLIDLRDPAAVARHSEQVKTNGFGPGDTPLFLLHATREFASYGDVVQFTLIPMASSTETYWISGMVLKPGPNGSYDGSIAPGYFNAEGTDWGGVNGLRVTQQIKVHTRMFNAEDNRGRHMFSFVVYDNQGNLVQQIWAGVSLVDSGENTPWFHIDKASVDRRTGLVNLTGRFPEGIPIYAFIGAKSLGYTITGPDPQYALYSTRGGTTLNGLSHLSFNRVTAVDIALWSPYTREAIFKSPALIEF